MNESVKALINAVNPGYVSAPRTGAKGTSVTDIFKEVEEELRRENVAKLWKKYGHYVIGVVVALVLGVAGVEGWQAYDLGRRSELSDKFAAALDLASGGHSAAALESLAGLAGPGDGGYGGLAAFEEARLLAESGDLEGAIAIWDRIAESSVLGPGFRGVAALLSVIHQLDDGDPAALRARLEPLAAEGQPFRASAQELLALLALRRGDRQAARELYTAIADNRAAPSGIRTRATQILAAIKD
ncbi:MAG: tetratricopeptide repeat protein [Kiloniellaceae bacterium]